jgi:DNA replication protein
LAEHSPHDLLQEGYREVLEGAVSVPSMLLKYYRQLNITDMEAMLLIHLLAFKQKEHKDFPALEEIQSRMSASPETVIRMIQRLLKLELLQIDGGIDSVTGVHYEGYNLNAVLQKLLICRLEEENAGEAREGAGTQKVEEQNAPNDDIFTVFEKEFARPLSPMECETISAWLDTDGYSPELVKTALKEAVFAGKVHLRYIDRILLEWNRNRVRTTEEAKAYTRKFRGG